jgi:hypothetical protein
VLAAGVPMAWLQGVGLGIERLRTPYGALTWHARAADSARGPVIEFDVQALRELPPGGLWLRGPWPAGARVWVDGVPLAGSAESIRLPRTPVRVRIEP